MQLARVVDQVVSTIHHEALAGKRMLLVRPVGNDRSTFLERPPLVAVDPFGARLGQLVITCEEGKAARAVVGHPGPPVRTFIVGIVDEDVEAD